MTRRLKNQGMALVAVFALSAVVASGAQAESFHFDHPSNGNKVTITGEIVTGGPGTVSAPHELVFLAGGPTVSCKMAKVEGTHANLTDNGTSLTTEELTLTTTTTECEVPTIGSATVTTTGCHYKLDANTTTETVESKVKQGHATIQCEAGKSIEFSFGGCVVKFGSQTPTGGVNYVNTGAGSTRDIDAEFHLTGLAFTTNKAFVCALAGIPESGTSATTKGNVTIQAFTDENPVENAGKTGVYTEGTQVGLWKE